MMPLLLSAEQWRLHPTFDGNVERIIDTPDYTYFLSHNQPFWEGTVDNINITMSLFRCAKDAEELEWLNESNMLSASVVHMAEYNFEKRYIAIAYDDGNIDLLYDNGDLVNITGLLLSGSDYGKTVNSITFAPENDEIYFATDFGYFVVDDKTGEFKYTKRLEKKVVGAARMRDDVIIATLDGVFSAPVSSHSIDDFYKVFDYKDIKRILRVDKDLLYVWFGDGWGGQVYGIYRDNQAQLIDKFVTNTMLRSMERTADGLLVSGYFDIWKVNKALEIYHIPIADTDYYNVVGNWKGDDFWFCKNREGLFLKNFSEENGWKIKISGFIPNASNAYKSDNMVYHPGYGLLVRNHGINNKFSSQWVQTTDLVSCLQGLLWKPMSAAYRSPSLAFEQWNPNGIAVDPNNPAHIYSGSYTHGLMRLDLDDPSRSLRFGREGDSANGLPGFIAVVPDMSYALSCTFSVPAFDSYGNMWVARHDYDRAEAKQNSLEILYWTPEDRVATLDKSTFKPFRKFSNYEYKGGSYQRIIPLTSSSSRNILMYLSGSWEECPIFIDHKGTIDNQGDDERVDVKEFTDQDGSKVNFAYILSSYEDPSTAQVWLGHDQGILYFRPTEIMKTGGRVTRIKVSRNDGTNLADYLLDGVSVNCILADNSGRKWFATGGGGVVVTSSDGTEVLKTYTSDNSDLPDNNVYAICYNPENNSMMISTDKGLAELFLSTAAGDSSDSRIKAYPNPVRPDYFGYVNIEGVSDNALIKIVDASGNLIKELGFAAGGEARWDLTNLNTKRVPGGVYYILASGSADGDGFSKVGKILVVN